MSGTLDQDGTEATVDPADVLRTHGRPLPDDPPDTLVRRLAARPVTQFDVLVHVDETAALSPLDPSDAWNEGETVPPTYPWAV